MCHIEKIKSGTAKKYLGPGILGGFIIGLIFFIIFKIGNSWDEALAGGLVFWFITFLMHFLAFLKNEWWDRKKKIKELRSKKYLPLIKSGFNLDNDLFYQKEIDNFYTELHIDTNKSHFLKVYCNYKYEDIDKIEKIFLNYKGIENLGYNYGIIFIKISNNISNLSDFIEELIENLIKNSLVGLTKNEFQKVIGNELEKLKKEYKIANTKTIKLGKLKLDITKNPEI